MNPPLVVSETRRGIEAPSRVRAAPDAAAERRLAEGTPLAAAKVIPSNAPMPLAAQRDFRGWIVIAILVQIIIGIALSVAVISKVANRTIYYAPTAERIGSSTAVREATTFEALTTAQMLVARMETYTPASASTVWGVVLPFLHPSLHEKTRANYEEIARKAERLWQHRVAVPLGAAIGGRNNGLITLAVFYDSIELTGRDEAKRELSRLSPKAAYLEFVMDVPTHENPLGLIMTRYQSYDKADWISRGFPDMWDSFRKLPEKRR